MHTCGKYEKILCRVSLRLPPLIIRTREHSVVLKSFRLNTEARRVAHLFKAPSSPKLPEQFLAEIRWSLLSNQPSRQP